MESQDGGLEYEVLAPVGEPKTSVIWLHGIGQDSDSLVPMAQKLELAQAGVRSVFPRAPQLLTSPLTGNRARAWFPVNLMTMGEADLAGMLAMEKQLRQLVDAEAALVGASHRVMLAGFSQGATMALRLGTRYPQRLGGLVLFAPFLVLDESLVNPYRTWKTKEPVWIGHGVHDYVIPTPMVIEVRNMLRGHGYRVFWNAYPGGHGPFEETLADRRLPTFIHTLLDRLAPRDGT